MKRRPPNEAALRVLIAHNARRHLLPKCGAYAKSSGKPCARLATANGRCRYHGGLTPKGDKWGKRQFNSDDPVKIDRKLATLERREKKRLARVAAMSPEKRKQYDRWRRTHKPGPKSARAADRERRRQDREARSFIEKALNESAKPQDGHLEQTAGSTAEIAMRPARGLFCEHEAIIQLEDDEMGDQFDPDIDEDLESALRRRVKTEGALAAYEAALSVCKDPKAPAQAKATAAATLFRVGGYFEKRDDPDDKDVADMSRVELDAHLVKLQRQLGDLEGTAENNVKGAGGLFD